MGFIYWTFQFVFCFWWARNSLNNSWATLKSIHSTSDSFLCLYIHILPPMCKWFFWLFLYSCWLLRSTSARPSRHWSNTHDHSDSRQHDHIWNCSNLFLWTGLRYCRKWYKSVPNRLPMVWNHSCLWKYVIFFTINPITLLRMPQIVCNLQQTISSHN